MMKKMIEHPVASNSLLDITHQVTKLSAKIYPPSEIKLSGIQTNDFKEKPLVQTHIEPCTYMLLCNYVSDITLKLPSLNQLDR